jgi:DNA replication and repair protein RecF
LVRDISLRNFRSYAELALELEPGFVLVVGPNGAGKTNLLEALHLGSQGFSSRTRAEQQAVRFGERAARVRLRGEEEGAGFETQVDLGGDEGKRVLLNGAPVRSGEELRLRLAALVFSPDRLAVVKGGPLVRRTYFDRMLGRVFPARAGLPAEYGRALAQRNAALRRAATGSSSPDAVRPWTERLAELGTELDWERAKLVSLLAPEVASCAEMLGLEAVTLAYEDRGLRVDELEERLARDLERGTTGMGPHLRDVPMSAGGRDLRRYGSQGEQRAAVLALVLAEAKLLAERRGAPPLLLLDDVFSELDERRRAGLLEAIPSGAQALVTATEADVLPAAAAAPDLLVRVSPGAAERT